MDYNIGMPGNGAADVLASMRNNIPAHDAQYLATMALASEQRLANLIAVATAKYADGSAMFPYLMGADGEGLVAEIKVRLGLRP